MPLCGQLSKDCLIKWRCFPGTANDSFSFYPNKEINRSANCYPVDFLARMFMAADREAAADRISLSMAAFCHNSEFRNHAIIAIRLFQKRPLGTHGEGNVAAADG